MFWHYIHFFDIALWLTIASSVSYVAFYAFVHVVCRRKPHPPKSDGHKSSFLILYPAYNEDKVIVHSVEQFLKQDYPSDKYHVMVISDHQQDTTNNRLRQLPVTLLLPSFKRSSKAKALRFAMANVTSGYDYVVVLDADNVVNPDFLSLLNGVANTMDYRAIQCHRCAKNADGAVSMLDGISEEINNTLFRKSHNAIGLSSALIGSGMCFDFAWFKSNVCTLSTAGEDRELEVMLLKQGFYIKYAEHIPVYDQKVSNEENFQRQRQRWMSAQVNCLLTMLPYLPKAIVKGNVNYIDKTLQQMLIPRSVLLVLSFILAVISIMLTPCWSLKWIVLFVVLCMSLLLAIPRQMRTMALLGNMTRLPLLAWKMIKGMRHIDRKNREFLHTSHE